jgi:hypothetical protein
MATIDEDGQFPERLSVGTDFRAAGVMPGAAAVGVGEV